MKRRRNDKTPLKQTRISNFFTKDGETTNTKRTRTDEKNENVESPDVILCTPPTKTLSKARKSLQNNFFPKNDATKVKSVEGVFNKHEIVSESKDLPNLKCSVKEGEGMVLRPAVSSIDVLLKSPLKPKARKSLQSNVLPKNDDKTSTEMVAPMKCVEGVSKKREIVSESKHLSNLKCSKNDREATVLRHAVSSTNVLLKSPLKSSENIISSLSTFQNIIVSKIEDFDSAVVDDSPSKSSENELTLKKCINEVDLIKLESDVKNSAIMKCSKILSEANSDANLNSDDFGFDDVFTEEWSTQGSSNDPVQFNLNFSSCLKCQVVSSETVKQGSLYETVVIVKSKGGLEFGRVLLRDMWVFVELLIEDDVSIVAIMVNNDWVIDAMNGYISIFPDILIPSTSLVGSMFCRRRGVLSNIFKGLDCDNAIMTIGSLAHELFQKAIESPICSKGNLEKIIENLLKTPNYLRMLYSCGLSCEEAKKELQNFIPFIIKFNSIYVKKELKPEGKNFQGTISEIVDIEESVSSVNIGFKGRIDVTVNVKINGKTKRMPLELKTGRASFSNEHRCQVILYTIMMSDLGEKIDSGLLMYLKEGILEEIKATRLEMRDMIMLRNDFVRYIKKFDKSILPEPIRMANSCKKCPYLTICTAYLDSTVNDSHPIRTIAPNIEPKHLEYFHKWSKLLLLENSIENSDGTDLKLTGIILEKGFVKLKNDFKYTFKKDEQNASLSAGSFVQLSPQNSTKNYFGRIVQITSNKCSVLLDKEINEVFGCIFNIQGYHSSLLSRYMTNLGCLMNEENCGLRKIVIDLEPASFEPKMPKSMLSKECLDILGKLNTDQQRAVLKVLTCKNYMLIEGPPGTGKTQTIASLISVLVLLKQTVLVVGHTHSSVDTILLRLKNLNFLRLGSVSNIHSEILDKSYGVLAKNFKSVTDIEKLFDIPVIASTCLGLDSDIVAKKTFDVCIVDESSQVLQPEVLKPLFTAKKFVLVGDKKQLRPVVKNKDAQELGMNISIFEHLYKPDSIVTLKYQYRMNRTLMDIANKLTYNDILKIGNDKVGKAVLKLSRSSSFQWLAKIMSTELNHSIVFVDTGDYLNNYPNENYSCANFNEAKLVETLVNELISCGLSEADIGVMAPFRAQIQILKDLIPDNVEVNTIDQYQGRDKNCIIFSCTKQDRSLGQKGEYELLNDERRLTVALTRAKHKLIIVGDKLTLIRYQTFKRIFSFLNDENFVGLIEGKDEFSWTFLQDV